MKKISNIIYICVISIIFAAYPSAVLAQTPARTQATVTPSSNDPVGEKLNEQINQLKERIASRVAELNLVEKRGIIGTVTDTSGNKITFKDLKGITRSIDVDEITKFSSPSARGTFGISDIVSGTKISVLGLYNKQSKRILGRFIETTATPVFISGRISNIDRSGFTVTVISEENKETTIDVLNTTLTSTYTKEDGISKSGFSSLSIGDKVMVTGYPDKNNSEILAASRILVLADLPNNPDIIVPEPTTEKELTPTTRALRTPADN